MKNSKRIFALATAALMSVSLLAGCGGGGNEQPSGGEENQGGGEATAYKIAIVPKMTNIGWFQRMEVGVKEYNETNGTDYVYGGPTDGADQASYVESLLAEEWDAICVVPFDSQSIAPVLAKAREAGIVVITHEAADMDPQYFDYDIEAFSNAEYGENFAKQLCELTNGQEGKYIQFVGNLSSVSHNQWCDAADAYFAENSSLVKLGRYETNDDTTQAYNKTKELLQANPDIIAIEGSASTDVEGAAQAVAELGLVGKVAIVGTSMASICGEHVKDGTIASFSVWDPAEAGKAMLDLAVAVLDAGGTIDVASTSLGAAGYETLTEGEGTPTVLYGNARVDVNADNIDQYNF